GGALRDALRLRHVEGDLLLQELPGQDFLLPAADMRDVPPEIRRQREERLGEDLDLFGEEGHGRANIPSAAPFIPRNRVLDGSRCGCDPCTLCLILTTRTSSRSRSVRSRSAISCTCCARMRRSSSSPWGRWRSSTS